MIRPAQGTRDDVINVERDTGGSAYGAPREPLADLAGELRPGVAVARPLAVIG